MVDTIGGGGDLGITDARAGALSSVLWAKRPKPGGFGLTTEAAPQPESGYLEGSPADRIWLGLLTALMGASPARLHTLVESVAAACDAATGQGEIPLPVVAKQVGALMASLPEVPEGVERLNDAAKPLQEAGSSLRGGTSGRGLSELAAASRARRAAVGDGE